MGVGISAGVGIGNGDASEWTACTREDVVVFVAVEQRVGGVAITVGPTVHRDRGYVARAGKSSGAEHAIELVADFLLEIRKGHGEQFCGPDPKLCTRIEPGI